MARAGESQYGARGHLRKRLTWCCWLLGPTVLALGLILTRPIPLAAADDLWSAVPSSFNSVLNTTSGLGAWIWTTNVYPRQTCRFWKAFEVPSASPVVRAALRIAADNGYTLFLDGREVGRGINWRVVTEYDVTWSLNSGTHVLAVDAFNDADTGGANIAGVVLGLRIVFADGHIMEVGTDQSWRVVPKSARRWETRTHAAYDWPPVKVISPWGGKHEWQAPLKIQRVAPDPPQLVHYWQTGWFQVTILSVCGVVGAFCLRLMAQVSLQSRAQQLLQLERARIARDIHDELGAGLTKLVLMGEVAQSEANADEKTRRQIGQLCERARSLSHSMDEVVWAVNSKRDTLRDFATYMCKYAQSFLESSPIRCRLDVEPEIPALPFALPVRRNLFLAVKEAINNAAKHSEATELYLHIHRQGEGLKVVVEDNGKGFDPSLANPERNGLGNMAQRMAEVGGACHMWGQPGAGCRVEFILPALRPQRTPTWLRWLPFTGPAHTAPQPPVAVVVQEAPANSQPSAETPTPT
jgi:signal transduction histidine kinase